MPAVFKFKTYIPVIKARSAFNFSFPNLRFRVLKKDLRKSVRVEGS